MCAKQHAVLIIEDAFGPLTPKLMSELGLPPNKYDAAMIKLQVLPHLRPTQRQFALDMALYGVPSNPFN